MFALDADFSKLTKDEKILTLLKSGKVRLATENLYAYYPVIHKLIIKNKGSTREAEDIYQEALMIVIKNLRSEGFTLRSRLSTYIYSVCRFLWNESLHKKNKSRDNSLVKDRLLEKYASLQQYRRSEAGNRMAEKAFWMLDGRCRQLLLLFYSEKRSVPAIMRILAFSSVQAVREEKYRCLEKAKEKLRNLRTRANE